MRELILKMSISVDGFVAAADGGIQWVFRGDPQGMAWTADFISNAGLHIMGSRTFRDMVAFWPTSTQIFAPSMNLIPKAVFTRQGPALKAGDTTMALRDARADAGTNHPAELQPGAESWAEAYLAGGDLAAEVAKLKAQDGKPIVAHGGAGFARSLIAGGLVDRYALLVFPVVLGNGLPIFSDIAAPRPLELIESKPFPSGAVAQIYRPA